MHITKWKKSIRKGYIEYIPKYITFWKRRKIIERGEQEFPGGDSGIEGEINRQRTDF